METEKEAGLLTCRGGRRLEEGRGTGSEHRVGEVVAVGKVGGTGVNIPRPAI